MRAIITNIQGYSIHDGPGIRTVVFLKGCGLRCQWCANPEGLLPEIQIGFIKNLCTHCGKCFSVCPEAALTPDEMRHRIDYDKCISCGKCVDTCLYKAMVQYGKEMSANEVFDAVRRDRMFYDTSGGGVTVSGGEPLLHAPFVRALFELCKAAGINTCVETSGFVSSESLLLVLPVTDYLLYDLKHMNSDIHFMYTGQRNELILENAKLAAKSDVDILFRVPLIPTVNDTAENIKATSGYIAQLTQGDGSSVSSDYAKERTPCVQLMPYHRLGDSKYQALDIPNFFRDCQGMGRDRIEEVRQAYIDEGLNCSISQ